MKPLQDFTKTDIIALIPISNWCYFTIHESRKYG